MCSAPLSNFVTSAIQIPHWFVMRVICLYWQGFAVCTFIFNAIQCHGNEPGTEADTKVICITSTYQNQPIAWKTWLKCLLLQQLDTSTTGHFAYWLFRLRDISPTWHFTSSKNSCVTLLNFHLMPPRVRQI